MVEEMAERADSWRLKIRALKVTTDLAVGDSLAVNGCCLTAVECGSSSVSFDLLGETRRLTNLSALGIGGSVNLERSLRPDGRMGGHYVTGHIDGMGIVEVFELRGADHYLRVGGPAGFGRYLVAKGSIAIDGISLTLAEVEGDRFAVWLIPHTLSITNVGNRLPGDGVNLEFDMMAKYVERLLGYRTAQSGPGPAV